MARFKPYRLRMRQSGATLVIALLVLVLIMMIGISAVSTSDTQFKLAGNLQFEDAAMNNAETAINTAEGWLVVPGNYLDAGFTAADPTKPQLLPRVLPRPAVRDTNPLTTAWWVDANTLSVGDDNRRYTIEQMSLNSKLIGSNLALGGRAVGPCNQVNTYLITARGTSTRGATKLVQSYYSVLSC